MDDILYIGIALALLLLTWGLLKMSESLLPEADKQVVDKSGGKS